MGTVRILSSEILLSTDSMKTPNHKIDLTPWDLQLLPFGTIQMGLFYHNPVAANQIHRLKHSLSSALSIFPPLAGRLEITEHENNTVSCSIVCNNAGALFVHAAADNITLTDILGPTYIPPTLHSLFPLNGANNRQGTSQPLLAVQVTELVDGITVAFTMNHVIVDGTSFWHFINSWAEISRVGDGDGDGGGGGGGGCLQIPKFPTLKRWFPNGIEPPIRFPFTVNNDHHPEDDKKLKFDQPQRLFHFAKEKIAELKSKANMEASKNEISSLQALLTHVWRSATRSKRIDPQQEVCFLVDIGVRPRLVPPLPEEYFGNALMEAPAVTMKAGELLEEGGLGKGAWEMHEIIGLHSDDKLKNHYESWLKTPSFIGLGGNVEDSNSLIISCSPRFDVYGNDFGWGKPVAARSGNANKKNGKITVYAGAEKGSIDVEVCLPYEILEAIGNDPEFMDFVSK